MSSFRLNSSGCSATVLAMAASTCCDSTGAGRGQVMFSRGMSGSGQRKAWGVGDGAGAGATVTGVVTGVGAGAPSDPPQLPASDGGRDDEPRAGGNAFFMAHMITHESLTGSGSGGVA